MPHQSAIGFYGSAVVPLYPPVIDDGNTVAWYDSQLLSTIIKDGSNLVSRWNDRLLSGRDLIQANGANQPTWNADGILSNLKFLKTAPFTLNQPEFVYIVMKQVTHIVYGTFFDGTANNSGNVLGSLATPRIYAAAPTASPDNLNLAVNTWGILRVLYHGANSKLIVNATTPTTWNCGTANMGGFTLGKIGTADLYYSNIHVKEILVRKTSDVIADETAIYNYLKTKYSL